MKLVTTSWDDGHPLDLRTAGLLAKYGIKGTFYAPVNYPKRQVLTSSQLHELMAMKMEIGSHTVTHPMLTQLRTEDIFREMRESRERLEQLLGEPVTAFCYPKGKFNATAVSLVSKAGYRLARTTMEFRQETGFDPAKMPVSCQFFPQTRSVYVRHALEEGNWKGLAEWLVSFRAEDDLTRLTRLLFDRVIAKGGIFHIWGHSWQLEDFGLWGKLEELLSYVARRPDVEYVSNTEALDVA